MDSLFELLQRHLKEFHHHDSINASNVEDALKNCPKAIDNDDLLHWWHEQDTRWIASLLSFMFWMWTTNRIEYRFFETTYDFLNSPHSKSWNMPLEITTGIDSPLLDGGFLGKGFSISQYRFSPSNHDLVVTKQEFPVSSKTIQSLDLALDYLSFLLDKSSLGHLGFRQKPARKWQLFENKIVGGMLSPEIRRVIPDFDFTVIEDDLLEIESNDWVSNNGFSLIELLRVRHRAILDSSLESKLITLWAGIEEMWGEELEQDFLLSSDEYKKVKKAIRPIFNTKIAHQKYDVILQVLSKLKSKTKNEKIIKELDNLECSKQWPDLKKTIGEIFSFRSRFAHGKSISANDINLVNLYISYLIHVYDELILQRLKALGVTI
ncbi:MAG: hypothetical protein HY867_11200 [Chloroflexi bacterium]|nr:hypothetical protein [Chloroflexota bacterium]